MVLNARKVALTPEMWCRHDKYATLANYIFNPNRIGPSDQGPGGWGEGGLGSSGLREFSTFSNREIMF